MCISAGSPQSHTDAFLVIEVPARRSGDLVNKLIAEHSQLISEAHAVWGESDVIARVSVPSTPLLAELVMEQIQKNTFVKSTKTFIVIEGMCYTHSCYPKTIEENIQAFVFVDVQAAKSEEIARELVNENPNYIVESCALWGESDVVLRVFARDFVHLSEIVMNEIQSMQYVSVTRTYICIPGMSEYARDIRQIQTGN